MSIESADNTLNVRNAVIKVSRVEMNTLSANTITSDITISGNATVSSNLTVSGNATVSSNLEVGTANLFVDTTTGGVGVGTTNPEGGLHISGKTFILGQISTVPTGPDGAMYYNSTLNQAFIKAGGSWISLTPFAAPTSISGLVGWYLPENWTGSQWTDVSGSGNHVTTYSGSILYDSSHNGETHGAETTFPVLYGSTSATMNFPSAILPSTYTLVSVTRYNGGTKQRILNGSPNNWLSGHHTNKAGVAFHDGWLTTEVDRHGTKWVIGVDQNSLYTSKSQSRNWETNTGGGGTSTNLRINTGSSNEPSDWMCAELIVYNRTLTYEEYRKLTDYIQNKYVIY